MIDCFTVLVESRIQPGLKKELEILSERLALRVAGGKIDAEQAMEQYEAAILSASEWRVRYPDHTKGPWQPMIEYDPTWRMSGDAVRNPST